MSQVEPEPHTPEARVPARAPKSGVDALIFLVFLGAAVVATQPLGSLSSTQLPGNADAVLNAWTLDQVCSGLTNPRDLFRGNMFFPDQAAILYSEPLLGIGLQSAPLCLLGLDHVRLFNASYVLVLALCALGAFLLAREITGSGAAALVAATVFAFTSANYDSAARIQIVASQWAPFCLLFLIRFCKGGRLRDAVLMGLSFAMQALSCTYYEIFLALLLVLATPFWIQLAGGLSEARRRLGGVAIAIVVSAVFVVPLNLAQQRQLDPVLASRDQAQEVTLGFFTDVLPTNVIYGDVLGRDRVAYDAMYFPGLLPIALAAWFLVRTLRRRHKPGGSPALKPLVFIGVAAFLFAFGTSVPTPWGDLPGPLSLFSGVVPGLGQARVPSRFLMFARLALAIIAACAAHELLSRFGRKAWAFASVLAAACFAEHWSTPLDTWTVPARGELPAVYRWLEASGEANGPILEFPPTLQRLRREESAWLHTAAFHGLPMANGYSSFRPAWHEFVMEAALRFPDERLVSILREVGVRTVIVHPRPRGIEEMDSATSAFLDYATGHPEQWRFVTSFSDSARLGGIWSRLGDEKVFELLPGPPAPRASVGPRLDRAGWSCRSTVPEAPDCAAALDGDPATLLAGTQAQDAGQSLKIRFEEPSLIHAVSIHLGRFPELFPRDAVVRWLDGDTWVPAEATLHVESFLKDMIHGSTDPVMTWSFEAVRAHGFEIRLRSGGHGFRPLGIPEIHAHAPLEASPPGAIAPPPS